MVLQILLLVVARYWPARDVRHKGRLNKSKKGKFTLQQGCKGEESQRQETLSMIGR